MTPKWSNEIRKTHLVKLFLRSGGFCVYGEPDCTIPEHHYEIFIEALIKDWIAEDRAEDKAQWQAERKAIHDLGERRFPIRGTFNNISRDIWHDKQPMFYLEAIGVSGVTLKPFARVKVSSSYVRLYVDLDDTLRHVSKNKRRKAIRYGKVDDSVTERVRLAVLDYLK
jgi:hypothetical protein